VLKILKNKKLARNSEVKIAFPPVNLQLDKQINFDEKKLHEPPKEVQHRKIKQEEFQGKSDQLRLGNDRNRDQKLKQNNYSNT